MMKNNDEKFIIRKIPLSTFLNLLNELYSSGADFVDLHGERDDQAAEDKITVAVPIEYMTEESQAGLEASPAPPGLDVEDEEVSVEITEEDMRDLLRHG